MIRNLPLMLVEMPNGVSVLVKISLILALGWLLHGLLSRSNPRWRVLLWRLVAVGLILMPLLGLAMPALQLPVPRHDSGVIAVAEPERFEENSHAPDRAAEIDFPPVPAKAHIPTPGHGRPNFVGEYFWGLPWAIWAAVCALLAGKLLIDLREVKRLVDKSEPVDGEIMDVFDKLRGDLGISRPVELRVSDKLSSPFLHGMLRPAIVLPERMTRGDYIAELPAIFAHELAHLKGRDLAWIGLIHALSIVLWFHPLTWRLRAAHAGACEAVCDAVAARHVGNSQAYSRTLARVALELVAMPPKAGGIAMARMPEIRQRLEALKRNVRANPLARRAVATALIAGFAILTAIAGTRFVFAEARQDAAAPMPAGDEAAGINEEATDRMLPAKLIGKVLDRVGKPIQGAKVVLYHNKVMLYHNKNRWGLGIVAETQSAADGQFTLEPKANFDRQIAHEHTEDSFIVLGLHPDHAMGWVNIHQKDSNASMILTLTEPRSETISITDMEGNPLKGARVWPSSIGMSDESDPLFKDILLLPTDLGMAGGTSDDSGQVTIHNLPNTKCSFYADLDGYAQWFGVDPHNTISLSKGANVSGTVVDEDGKGISGATVSFYTEWLSRLLLAQTDGQGRFEFNDLPAKVYDKLGWGPGSGTFAVQIEHPNVMAENRMITLEPGQNIRDMRIVAKKGTLQKVRFVESGSEKPLAGARIQGKHEGGKIDGYSDSAGMFSIPVLPGKVLLFVSSPPGVYIDEEDVNENMTHILDVMEMEAGIEPAEVMLKTPPIAGRLVNVSGVVKGPDSGVPPGVKVYASAGGFRTSTKRSYIPTAGADASGRFTLEEAPAGRELKLYAETPDRLLAAASVVAIPADPDQVPEIQLTLIPTITFRKSITDDEGKPVPNKALNVRPVVGGETISPYLREVTTDNEGYALLDGVVSGLEYNLRNDAELKEKDYRIETMDEVFSKNFRMSDEPGDSVDAAGADGAKTPENPE